MRSFTKKFLWLHTLLFCMLPLFSFSQELTPFVAMYPNATAEPNSPDRQVARKALSEALSDIKSRFNVKFIFETEIIQNKIVSIDLSGDEDVNLILKKLFSQVDLQIKKIGDNSYIIFRKAENEKVEKVTTNTLSADLSATSDMPSSFLRLRSIHRTLEAAHVKTITGKVTDENNEALPGVNVLVKNTTVGTVTDVDGNYRLNVSDEADTLMFTSVGYAMEEVIIGNQTVINISLLPDIKSLSEVVVVGYGTQTKSGLTGSVASIDTKQIKNLQGVSMEQGLAATVPGVNVVQTTGRPGGGFKVNIRGINNLAGNTPLYVIDGVQYDAGYDHLRSPLAFLDPQDIESIDVLKDAAAASIYGSQGAGGVVIITTKKGKAGQSKITFDYNIGVQRAIGIPEMMDAETYAQAMIEARNNGYIRSNPGASITDPDEVRGNHRDRIGIFTAWQEGQTEFLPLGFKNVIYLDPNGVDWYDETFRDNPLRTTYRLSASGGTDKLNYYVAGSYRKEDGLIDGYSGFERYSFRANIESKLTNKITLGVNLNPTFTHDKNMRDEGRIHISGIYTSSLVSSPITAVRRPDGLYQSNITGHVYGIQNNENPVLKANEWKRENNQFRTIGRAYVNFELLKGLDFNSSASVNFRNNKTIDFKPYTVGTWGLSGGTPDMTEEEKAQRRSKTNSGGEGLNWQIVERLTYETTLFNDHNIKLMGAFEAIRDQSSSWYISANRYPSDFFSDVILGEENIVEVDEETGEFKNVQFSANTGAGASTLASFIGRLEYSFKGRYNLTASLRRDGYSGFGPESRWGTFPSLGVNWIISEEAFMKNVPVLSLLKVRFSTGKAGRRAGRYNWLTTVSPTNYVYGGSIVSAFRANNINDYGLAWEELESTTFGIEAGFFNDRVIATAEYYKNNNSQFINNLDIPSITGQNSIRTNFGDLQSQGFEFSLNTRNFVKDNFQWSTNLNATYTYNELVSFGLDPRARSFASIKQATSHVTEQNAPISNFWLRPHAGIYATEEDLASYPIFVDKQGSRLGDQRFLDVNRDGIITEEEDRMVMGSPWAKWFFGMVNNINYKNFELSFTMQGKLGNKIYDFSRLELITSNTNMLQEVWDGRWQSPENPGDGINGILSNNSAESPDGSSLLLFDASYLAMRNITLAYNIPLSVTSRLGMQGVRLYGTVENAFFLKNYYGNPEAEASGDDGDNDNYEVSYAGTDFGTYPLARVFMLGASITF